MSDAPLDGLERVLDVAHEAAASVDREARFPHETINALAETGLLGLTIPPSAGGSGGGPDEFLRATRALSARCASSAMIYLMHVCAAQVTLAGSPSGDAAALRGLASGQRLGTLAFSERGSRSHFWAPVSQIAGGKISAQKSFVTSAGHAKTYVVSTRPEGVDEPLASSLYLVGDDASGIDVGPAWEGLGLRGNASAPMTFDTPLGEAEPLGEEGKGLDLMLGVVLPWFQLGSSAVSVGIAEGAVQAGVAHVTGAKLEHLGQTLIELPTVRARIGRSQTEVDAVGVWMKPGTWRSAWSTRGTSWRQIRNAAPCCARPSNSGRRSWPMRPPVARTWRRRSSYRRPGGIRADRLGHGVRAVRELRLTMHRRRVGRLRQLGFDDDVAEQISALHTGNFM